MNEAFDPYYKWLGIKPKDQPPNHYRLLGVELFESDTDVIENAADQRMRHMRSLQTGANAEASQRILNEVAAARVCLTDPVKRAEYDCRIQTIRAVDTASTSPTAPPVMGTAAPPVAATAPPKALPQPAPPVGVPDRIGAPDQRISSRPGSSRLRTPSKSKSSFPLGLVLGIAAVLGVVILAVAVLSVVRQDRSGLPKPPGGTVGSSPPPQRNSGGTTVTPPPRTTGGSSVASGTTGGGSGQSLRPQPTGELHLAAIAPITLQAGQQLRVQAIVRDHERWKDKVRFAVGLGTPSDAKVDPKSGWLEWTPPKDARRTYLFNIEARSGADEDTISFQVDLPWARGDLVFYNPGEQTAYPGEPLVLSVRATDDVGPSEGAHFDVLRGPPGATVDSVSRQFRWLAGEDQLDKTHRVNLRVTDARGVSATTSFGIRVQKKPPPMEGTGTTGAKTGADNGPRNFEASGAALGDPARRRFELRFDGQAYVATSWRYDGSTPLTLEAIVAPHELRQSAIVGCMHLSGVGLTLTVEQRWAFVVRDRDRNRQIVSDEPASPARRVHLAGVFSDGKVRLFVDGKPQRDTAVVEKFVPSTHPILIAADTNGEGHPEAFFQGKILSVRASSKALYTEPFQRPWRLDSKDDTALLLVFDQGEGNEVRDRSGKNPPAKIHGAAWVPRERQ